MNTSLRRYVSQQNLRISVKARFRPSFDPFRYTQGRWLNRDRERREARSLHFNFDALLDVAVRCSPGARRVTDCEKREGGFNRVFTIHLDNKDTVVARLPTRLAGPPGLTVSSEVATLQYVRERTTIPVPKVLSWNADPRNRIGTEYMILDKVDGVPLKDVWSDMTASQHVACIRSMGNLCKQLCQFTFPAYGSLYLNNEAPAGAVRLDETFCIGPVCASQHWGCSIDSTMMIKSTPEYQGPWHDMENYFAGLIARVRASLRIILKGAETSHLELLDLLQQSLSLLTTTQVHKTAGEPTLFHPDFHTRNIFVDSEDHTKVTGVIDWQSTAIEPAFVFASETPDFAKELPDEQDSESATVTEQAANAKVRADAEFCAKAWLVMQQTFEKVRPASRLDSSLLHVLAAPSFGWADNEITLHMLLDELAQSWEELDLPGRSIYQPSETGATVVERLDEYHAKRRLQDHLTRLLSCDDDGWVSNDRWQEVLPRYRLEYSRFVESAVKSEECTNDKERAIAVGKANRLWPYDQR